MKPKSAMAAIGGLALLALLTIVALQGSSRRTGGHPGPSEVPRVAISADAISVEAVTTPQAEQRTAVPQEHREGQVPALTSGTARHFLSEYWGDDWAEVEASMLKEGVNLDVSYEFTPWEEASLAIEKEAYLNDDEVQSQLDLVLDWPQDESIEALQAKFPGLALDTDVDRQALLDVVAPFNEKLAQLGEAWVARLDLRLREKWSQGDFLKAPYTTLGVKQERGFYSTSPAADGWAVQLVLKQEDCPEMVGLMAQVNKLQQQRAASIRQHIRRR